MTRPRLPPTLAARLRSGPPLGVIWCALGSPAVVEAARDAGAEAVVIDLQHGLWDRAGLEAAVEPRGGPTLVRVEDDSFAAIGRALDAGAEGVLVPLIETAAQAAAVVRACRYPPLGARSGGGVRPLADFPAWLDWAAGTVAGVMIETEAAAARAAEIAAVPGLDLVFAGTGDLILSIGRVPDAARRHEAALTAIRTACARAGVPCGLFTASPAESARRQAEGWALTVHANDLSTLRDGFAAALRHGSPGRGD